MTEQLHAAPIALKEWAVTVQALAKGDLIMVLRKGGISEETRDFQLRTPSFYLLPAYEHQRHHLLKEPYQEELDRVLAQWQQGSGLLTLDTYAEAVADIEITDQETLDKLRDCHIWTDTFAEERLKWKRQKPLHLLLLRVYKLEEGWKIPASPAYTGCKSWIELTEEHSAPPMRPVLDDTAFAAKVAKIQAALGDKALSIY